MIGGKHSLMRRYGPQDARCTPQDSPTYPQARALRAARCADAMVGGKHSLARAMAERRRA